MFARGFKFVKGNDVIAFVINLQAQHADGLHFGYLSAAQTNMSFRYFYLVPGDVKQLGFRRRALEPAFISVRVH